jgi:hypothetical protein
LLERWAVPILLHSPKDPGRYRISLPGATLGSRHRASVNARTCGKVQRPHCERRRVRQTQVRMCAFRSQPIAKLLADES